MIRDVKVVNYVIEREIFGVYGQSLGSLEVIGGRFESISTDYALFYAEGLGSVRYEALTMISVDANDSSIFEAYGALNYEFDNIRIGN